MIQCHNILCRRYLNTVKDTWRINIYRSAKLALLFIIWFSLLGGYSPANSLCLPSSSGDCGGGLSTESVGYQMDSHSLQLQQ